MVRVLLCFVAVSSLIDTRDLFADAFATYLLGPSGCETDLDTTEVIMNHKVVAAEDSDDLNIHVYVVGSEDRNSILKTYPLDEFPMTLDLQVVTKPNPNVFPSTSAYQFAIEVAGKAYFPKGACEGKKRAAGSTTETIQVVVEEPGATVWAAWASAHEKVRLTPVLEFIANPNVVAAAVVEEEVEVVPEAATDPDPIPARQEVKEVPIDDGRWAVGGGTMTAEDEEIPQIWFNFVNMRAGCTSVDLSDANLSLIQKHPVHHDTQHELHVEDSGTPGKIPAELSLSLDASYSVVVLEASPGASWETGYGAPGCNFQRVAIGADETWPKLIIHEDVDIRVWAVYSVGHTPYIAESATLYRTSHLKLEYESSSKAAAPVEPVDTEPEELHHTELEAVETDLEMLPEELTPAEELLEEETSEKEKDRKEKRRIKERRRRPAKRADRQLEREEERHEERHAARVPPLDRPRHDNAREATKEDRRAAAQAAARARHQDPVDGSTATASLLQAARGAATGGGDAKAPVVSPLNVDPVDDFSAGPSYFMGMAILVVATAVSIKVCLVASQRNMKGRRDL
jgi:hypothetical protein